MYNQKKNNKDLNYQFNNNYKTYQNQNICHDLN